MSVVQACAHAQTAIERARPLFGPAPEPTTPAGGSGAIGGAAQAARTAEKLTAGLSGALITQHQSFVDQSTPVTIRSPTPTRFTAATCASRSRAFMPSTTSCTASWCTHPSPTGSAPSKKPNAAAGWASPTPGPTIDDKTDPNRKCRQVVSSNSVTSPAARPLITPYSCVVPWPWTHVAVRLLPPRWPQASRAARSAASSARRADPPPSPARSSATPCRRLRPRW
jgi:hypothetical protein